jgi:hypothetical protein
MQSGATYVTRCSENTIKMYEAEVLGKCVVVCGSPAPADGWVSEVECCQRSAWCLPTWNFVLRRWDLGYREPSVHLRNRRPRCLSKLSDELVPRSRNMPLLALGSILLGIQKADTIGELFALALQQCEQDEQDDGDHILHAFSSYFDMLADFDRESPCR